MKHKQDWGPGYRFFECECGEKWRETSRDCASLSSSSCGKCFEVSSPYKYEPHYEWDTDKSGNLMEEDA